MGFGQRHGLWFGTGWRKWPERCRSQSGAQISQVDESGERDRAPLG